MAWAENNSYNELDIAAEVKGEQRIVTVDKERENDNDTTPDSSSAATVKMIVGGQSEGGVAKELELPVKK